MALIRCKGCGQMVSDRAEKCPKCGYSVRLSMEQQEETKQSVEPHTTTLNTSKEEVTNDNPKPQQRGSKKGIIIAIIVVVIIGCGVLFALLNKTSNPNTQQTNDIPSVEAKLHNVRTIQEAKQLIEGTVWEHTVNTDESELGYWVKVEFANGRYKTFYMNPSDEGWTNGGEGVYEIKEGKFANTGEKYVAVHWEGGGYKGWPMKYALILNNFQITVQSAVPDLDALYSYRPQPTSSGFMKLVKVFKVESNLEEQPLSDSLAVATENNDFVVSDSCVTDTWEYITLYGSMSDVNGTYPIELSFEKDGSRLMNCIYTNVDLGGKIRMDGTVSDNDLIFIGKDGNNSFRICVNSHTLKGYAQDGDKRLQVSLSHNRSDSQNTLQQGPSWLQGTWIYHYDEDKRPSDGDCIYAEVTIKGNKLKVITRDSGSDFTYKYEGTWQYKDEGEGYFIYYFKDGGKGIEIDFDKKVLIVPDYKYVKDGDEWRRIYKYMKKVSD